jgi:hypothetical protein
MEITQRVQARRRDTPRRPEYEWRDLRRSLAERHGLLDSLRYARPRKHVT